MQCKVDIRDIREVHESSASLSENEKNIRKLITLFYIYIYISVTSVIYNTAAYMITRRLHVES